MNRQHTQAWYRLENELKINFTDVYCNIISNTTNKLYTVYTFERWGVVKIKKITILQTEEEI